MDASHKEIEAVKTMEELRINTVDCRLVWKNFNYYIPTGGPIDGILSKCSPRIAKENQKQILCDIAGYAEPGQFLAIIGPSGAGKTTLLNILCKRMRVGHEEGDLTLNGISLSSTSQNNKYSKVIGYVMQHDALLPFLTVFETLLYSGMLSLPRSFSYSMKLRRINELMTELGLSTVANQYVGDELVRGISGGEKKRLSIAIELLRSPSVLFLDEPTSGLDAKNALRLCENLARLAHKYNYTVITTIHQPRSQIFAQFDTLLILAGGGRQIYFGPAAKALGYFSAEGLDCPMHENPADYFIDCVTMDYKDVENQTESKERVDKLVSRWEEQSPLTDMDPYESNGSSNLSHNIESKGANLFQQIFWVLYRGTLNEVRNKPLLMARLGQAIFISVIIGVLYFQIDNDQSTISDRNGITFFLIINSGFNEIIPTVNAFGTQRVVFFRERDSRTYSIFAFWVGKQLSMLFVQLALPSIVMVIVYWMIGLQAIWYKFFIFYACLMLVSLICGTAGLILGASLPPSAASALAPIFVLVSMIFSGFLVNLDNISSFISWLQWISFGKYAFDVLIQNEYSGLILRCTSGQFVGDGTVCPVTRGEQVISNLSISELPIPIDLMILFIFLVVLRLVLLLVLKKARPTGQ